jgi:hypothetical protein
MQNTLMMAPLIKKTNGFSNATGDGRIGHIDARDVADVRRRRRRDRRLTGQHGGKEYWPTCDGVELSG